MSLDPAMTHRVRNVPVYVGPRLREIKPGPRLYADVPLWKRRVKRAIDVVSAVVALTCFTVMLPLIALIIRLDSRGPIFYAQQRVGINRRTGDRRRDSSGPPSIERRSSQQARDRRKVVAQGQLFTIYKLRTMRNDAESMGPQWASKSDARITRVGAILRKTRLDEVPQFWNVLRGEMSLVGPRPERPPFIDVLSNEVPGYVDRLRFKPGITGLSQVELGYDTDVESVRNKVETDVRYISEFGLRLDLKIMLRTVRVVLTGEGAY